MKFFKSNHTFKLAGLFLVAFFMNFNLSAQTSLGGGVSYGSEIDEPGINIRGGAMLGDNFRISGDLNYFFPGDDGFYDVDVWGLNFNGAFILPSNEGLYVYPLAGLNITTIKSELGDFEDTRTEMGLNLGGGLGVNLGAVTPFIEGKYVISDYDQAVVSVGLLFNLGE